ncbi:hypothetical protein C2E23DRAFT_885943 [Lenzites betulinus]|nr:hypothetical protein C2E23DRAFT_885943 [Lenzites betulinus]
MGKEQAKGAKSRRNNGGPSETQMSDSENSAQAKRVRGSSRTPSPEVPRKRAREDTAERTSEASRTSTPFKNPFAKTTPGKKHQLLPANALAQLAAASVRAPRATQEPVSETGGSRTRTEYAGGGPANLLSTKRMSDQFVDFRTKLAVALKDVKHHDAEIENHKAQLDSAFSEIAVMGGALNESNARARLLQSKVEQLEDRLAFLEQRPRAATEEVRESEGPKEGGKGGEKQDGDKQAKTGKEGRDNALQDAIRKCMSSLMGIAFGAPLPLPCDKGTWYEAVYESDEDGMSHGAKTSTLGP